MTTNSFPFIPFFFVVTLSPFLSSFTLKAFFPRRILTNLPRLWKKGVLFSGVPTSDLLKQIRSSPSLSNFQDGGELDDIPCYPFRTGLGSESLECIPTTTTIIELFFLSFSSLFGYFPYLFQSTCELMGVNGIDPAELDWTAVN